MCPCFMLQENLVGFVHDASLLYVAKKTCFNFPLLYVQAHFSRTTLSWDGLVGIKFVFLTIS